ncbi:MAG: DNA ligase D [Rhodosalinus sp.]
MASPDRLADYNARRDFARTDEPQGLPGDPGGEDLRFVVQKHDASRLHYDFRIEWDGALLSWAVTKGPSRDPSEKRLAVRTEDHPLSYADFEGTIPEGEYGAGTVMLWDEGTWEPRGDVEKGLKEGELKMSLHGQRMQGNWVLVRMNTEGKRENWLLIKERDNHAGAADTLTDDNTTSVRTGRSMKEIADGATPKGGPKERKLKPPPFRKPQLATLVKDAPRGDDWWHETKFDGYRALVSIGRGGVRIFSRSGKDWTDTFAALDGAFDPLDCDAALIDGEVMAAKIEGSPFSSLQRALSEGRPLVFFAFDLLSLDGEDLTDAPLSERRGRLAELFEGLPGGGGPLRMSQHVEGHGPEVHAAACRAGAEGIISKKADAPYRGTRTKTWLKVKCARQQEFVVGGYSPSDKPGRPFSSLLLGTWREGDLVYRGRVGTGFSDDELERLAKRFHARKTSPFAEVPKSVRRNARWVRPEMVVEVAFTEFTKDGAVRHASYLGERHDKPAKEVGDEPEHEVEEMSEEPEIAGVRITHPDRQVFPKAGCTKRDVARHYERVGERMAPLVADRPLSLVRCPDGIEGECFFQKHGRKGFPDALGRVEIEEKDGGTAEYLTAGDTAALVAAAQMGTLEFHIWGARADRLERPDRMVFDLDPDEGMGWSDIRQAAFDIRGHLREIGLDSGVLLTGGKGLHVWMALRRISGWDTVKGFARTFAHALADREPRRFTATMSKSKRKGRIFVDWLRNERGATAIAPYSLRARPGAPVAVPVTWEELEDIDSPAAFGMGDMADRLTQDCPYAAQLEDLQSVGREAVNNLDRWIADGS